MRNFHHYYSLVLSLTVPFLSPVHAELSVSSAPQTVEQDTAPEYLSQNPIVSEPQQDSTELTHGQTVLHTSVYSPVYYWSSAVQSNTIPTIVEQFGYELRFPFSNVAASAIQFEVGTAAWSTFSEQQRKSETGQTYNVIVDYAHQQYFTLGMKALYEQRLASSTWILGDCKVGLGLQLFGIQPYPSAQAEQSSLAASLSTELALGVRFKLDENWSIRVSNNLHFNQATQGEWRPRFSVYGRELAGFQATIEPGRFFWMIETQYQFGTSGKKDELQCS